MFDSLGPLAPSPPPGGAWGVDRCGVGGNYHQPGGWWTMLTGDMGSLIGRRPLGTREEIVTGAWTVHPLQGHHRGLAGWTKRERMVCDFIFSLQIKVLHEGRRAATLHNIALRRVNLAFFLVHSWFVEWLWLGKDCKSMFEGTKLPWRAVLHKSGYTTCFDGLGTFSL